MADKPCPWCEHTHDGRFLCDPAERVLTALYERGMRGDQDPVVFPEPIAPEEIGRAMGADPGDRVVETLQVLAGTVPVAGIPHPVLIFTGVDVAGQQLPRWIRPGTEGDHARTVKLVSEMAELAARQARKQRAEAAQQS